MSEFVENSPVTLENIGGGACGEKFAIELERVIENILDPNTDGRARSITLTVKIKPTEKNRALNDVEVHCQAKLSNPVEFSTSMYVGTQRGALVAFEHNPEQLTFDDVKSNLDTDDNVVSLPGK